MILDALLKVSASQSPTQGTSTVSSDAVDLGDVTPKRRIADGEPLALVVFVESITGSADTYTFTAIEATAAALNAGVNVLAARGPYAAAAIPEGTAIVIPLPPGTPVQRYIGARYTLGASDAITVSAYFAPLSFIQKLQTYRSAVVI